MSERKDVNGYRARSLGRVLAFQASYQMELNRSEPYDWEEALELYCAESQTFPSGEEREKALSFAKRLFEGVIDRRVEVDRILNEALDKRSLKQTNVVDRSILRIATYEARFLKTPKPVVISEAIDLGLRFGDKGSRAFLNGVLDQVDKVETAPFGTSEA